MILTVYETHPLARPYLGHRFCHLPFNFFPGCLFQPFWLGIASGPFDPPTARLACFFLCGYRLEAGLAWSRLFLSRISGLFSPGRPGPPLDLVCLYFRPRFLNWFPIFVGLAWQKAGKSWSEVWIDILAYL